MCVGVVPNDMGFFIRTLFRGVTGCEYGTTNNKQYNEWFHDGIIVGFDVSDQVENQIDLILSHSA